MSVNLWLWWPRFLFRCLPQFNFPFPPIISLPEKAKISSFIPVPVTHFFLMSQFWYNLTFFLLIINTYIHTYILYAWVSCGLFIAHSFFLLFDNLLIHTSIYFERKTHKSVLRNFQCGVSFLKKWKILKSSKFPNLDFILL